MRDKTKFFHREILGVGGPKISAINAEIVSRTSPERALFFVLQKV